MDIPVDAGAKAGAARLLDRTGQPVPLPVAVSERTEAGQRWISAELTLAPLGAGDYTIEVSLQVPGEAGGTGSGHKVISAIRVVR